MDKQLYKDLMQYLEILTYPENYTDNQKIHLRKASTHYFVKNHILFRRSKLGTQRVILHEQVEPILFHLH